MAFKKTIMKGIIMHIKEPDRSNPNNYVLDTSVYNHLCDHSDYLDVLISSLENGYCYYTSDVQEMEKDGYGANLRRKDSIFTKPPEQSDDLLHVQMMFEEANRKLHIAWIRVIATALHDYTRIDNTMRFPGPDDSPSMKLYYAINAQNKPNSTRPCQHSHDAIIAEAAVFYGCQLVTDDESFQKTVNDMYPGTALSLSDLIARIRK